MTTVYTKSEIIEKLQSLGAEVGAGVRELSPEQFDASDGEEWSASGYLQHLILSVKPLARGMSLPADQLEGMFGIAEQGSRSYDALVEAYKKRLAEGVRAEDYERVTPTGYRFPEEVQEQNKQAYLAQTWEESMARLLAGVAGRDEADLDRLQLPHPAVNMLTLREMLYFTLHHTGLHWGDIQRVGGLI